MITKIRRFFVDVDDFDVSSREILDMVRTICVNDSDRTPYSVNGEIYISKNSHYLLRNNLELIYFVDDEVEKVTVWHDDDSYKVSLYDWGVFSQDFDKYVLRAIFDIYDGLPVEVRL